MEEKDFQGMKRKEIIAAAKAKADELGMSMPFGGKTLEAYKEMALTGKGLIPNETKRKGKRRVPLGSFRQNLVVPESLKEPGYHYHIIEGDPTRLEHAVEGGYEFVVDNRDHDLFDEHEGSKRKTGKKVSYVTGKNADGSSRIDYLMRIKQEFYDEDQREKEKIACETDKLLKKGKFQEGKDDKRYIPDDGSGISIDTNIGP